MKFRSVWNGLFLLAALLFSLGAYGYSGNPPLGAVTVAELPREARHTLELIRQGGPFPHARDGVVFGNREGLLPKHRRGYYHEYTVRTPGVKGRGARRIVVGGNPASSRERYYTADHYNTFKRITE